MFIKRVFFSFSVALLTLHSLHCSAFASTEDGPLRFTHWNNNSNVMLSVGSAFTSHTVYDEANKAFKTLYMRKELNSFLADSHRNGSPQFYQPESPFYHVLSRSLNEAGQFRVKGPFYIFPELLVLFRRARELDDGKYLISIVVKTVDISASFKEFFVKQWIPLKQQVDEAAGEAYEGLQLAFANEIRPYPVQAMYLGSRFHSNIVMETGLELTNHPDLIKADQIDDDTFLFSFVSDTTEGNDEILLHFDALYEDSLFLEWIELRL